jgi:hypothetical protein
MEPSERERRLAALLSRHEIEQGILALALGQVFRLGRPDREDPSYAR